LRESSARRCAGVDAAGIARAGSQGTGKLYFGDNIPEEPSKNPGQDNWRVRIAMARLWRDAVNRHGGDVTLVHLPDLRIRGNTHFAFSDLNNVQIADLLSSFLAQKHLD
jgi:hypothetical protein